MGGIMSQNKKADDVFALIGFSFISGVNMTMFFFALARATEPQTVKGAGEAWMSVSLFCFSALIFVFLTFIWGFQVAKHYNP